MYIGTNADRFCYARQIQKTFFDRHVRATLGRYCPGLNTLLRAKALRKKVQKYESNLGVPEGWFQRLGNGVF